MAMVSSYTTRAICRLTGLTRRQVDYWDRISLINPSVQPAAGVGTVRRYGYREVVQFRVVRALQDAGISLQKVRKSVDWLCKHLPDVEKPLAELRFITDGENVFTIAEDAEALMDVLKNPGQFALMVIPLGRMLEELKGDVERLAQDRERRVRVNQRLYRVVLTPDLDEGGYVVECPQLPGCISEGNSEKEALAMVREAIAGWTALDAELKTADRQNEAVGS